MELKLKRITSFQTKDAVQNISQILFESEVQTHIIHLQAVNKSFEIHNALGAFYESLADLNDNLVEKSFCKAGLLMSYKNITISNNLDYCSYIKQKMTEIEAYRENIKEGYIQQIVDNILEQYAHVTYKLENLQ